MARSREEIIPIEQVTSFYSIAYASLVEVNRLVGERARYERAVAKQRRQWTEEDLEYLALHRLNPADEERVAVVAVIFSALTLEALINDYAISNFSREYSDNYLDRLSIRSKWLIIPQLVKGTAMSTDGQTFQRLTELFRLRDRLVHFKTRKNLARDVGEKDRVTKKHAVHAIRTVGDAVAELKSLDGRVSLRWLNVTEAALVE